MSALNAKWYAVSMYYFVNVSIFSSNSSCASLDYAAVQYIVHILSLVAVNISSIWRLIVKRNDQTP